jgi:pimeloyl-ACP methyl ester carboxylesterase
MSSDHKSPTALSSSLATPLGGCVALAYALAYPHFVEGLILCNAVASVAFAEALLSAVREHGTAAQLSTYERAFIGAITTDDAFRDAWNVVLPLYFHRYKREYGDRINQHTLYSAEGFNRFVAEALPAYAPNLAAVTAPTLVLTGAQDIIVAPEHGSARLHREISGSRFHTFAGSGHFPFIEENADFIDVVSRWLRTCGS